jgi:hypothetical protein
VTRPDADSPRDVQIDARATMDVTDDFGLVEDPHALLLGRAQQPIRQLVRVDLRGIPR